jgi:DNA-binding transcriptional LysR family regulator
VRLAAAPELVPVLLTRSVQTLLAETAELTLEIVALSSSPASAAPGAVPGASRIHEDGPVETGVRARLLAREIDMALLVTEAPPQELIGRQLATLDAAVYGAPETWATWREANSAVLWISGGDDSPRAMSLRRDCFPDTPVRLRIDDVHGRRQAVEAGLGLALLPCHLGDASAGLVPAAGVSPVAIGDAWLLTRPDSRGVPRIQAVSTFLQTLFLQHASAFAGRLGSGSIGTNVVGAAS